MLENMNDYLSIAALLLAMLFIFGIIIYLINLRVIEKNLKREVNYYKYEKK